VSEDEFQLYPWRKAVRTLPDSVKIQVVNLIKMGHVPQLSGSREDAREKLGIDRAPPTAYKDKSALLEIQQLIKESGLDEKIAWNWRKEKPDY
jgi:heterodisulfide reductase subunit C